MLLRICLLAIALTGCSMDPAYRIVVAGSRATPTLIGLDDGDAMGIAIDPEVGTVQLVYSQYGLDVTLITLARDSHVVTRGWAGTLDSAMSAVTAVGDGRYAYVTRDGGYVLDTVSGASELRFCLVPGAAEDLWPPQIRQRSNALAYDPISQQFWAQPRTSRDGEVVLSQIAAFDAESGDELGWWTLEETSFRAEAMTVLPDGRLLLADWTALHAFDPGTGRLAPVATLRELGLVAVTALAYDATSGHVLALDSAPSGARVVELEVSRLD